MIAGLINSVVTFSSPVKTVNAYGEEKITSWKDEGKWRAQRQSISGKRTEEVGEHFEDLSAKYIVRWGHQPKAGWRLVTEDGVTYEVAAIEPNRRRGLLTLNCNRVNL